MSRKIKYTFFITPDLNNALKTLKQRDGIAEAEAIRRALAAYLGEKGVLQQSTIKAAPRRARTRRKA
jgi:hypothetical protein